MCPGRGDGWQSENDCFWFWNGCAPFSHRVHVLPADNEIRLQRVAVESAIESRLQAAKVYTDAVAGATLYLYVNLEQYAPQLRPSPWTRPGDDPAQSFEVELHFRKRVSDAYGNTGFARTWHSFPWRRGSHGGRASEVMEAVRRELDEFMNDYLRVNAPACEARTWWVAPRVSPDD